MRTPSASRCWTRPPPKTGTVDEALVDQGFIDGAVAHGQKVGIKLEIWSATRADRVRSDPQAVDRGARLRDLDTAPPVGARLRAPHLRIAGLLGDDRSDTAPADRGNRAVLAHRMTGDQLTLGAVLARLEEREQQIATQTEAAKKRIAELSAQLEEFHQPPKRSASPASAHAA
ncbi:hypothetical protein [Streptomyces canus]|uniref:hypothetical protein n=1 Tax=Streptomyces canus TaxID=58343 RepID=UPI00324E170A